MNDNGTEKSDNLSELSRELKRVENTYIQSISVELTRARNAVAGSLPGFKLNRMNFGRVLRAYKEHFKAKRGWTAAMKVIADALHCDERTVDRIIEDYERASKLSTLILDEMEEQKIRPGCNQECPNCREPAPDAATRHPRRSRHSRYGRSPG